MATTQTPAGPAPVEAWLLAGTIDGVACAPAPRADVAGMPNVLRHACALAAAGIRRVVVLGAPAAALEGLVGDRRLKGAELVAAAAAPEGDGDGAPVVVARCDRVIHRDLPKLLVAGRGAGGAAFDDVDALALVPRARARELVDAAARPGGIGVRLGELRKAGAVEVLPLPWKGFAVAAPDRRALRAAEWRLVDSLRKQIDGLASKYINRHISLRTTRALMRTPVMPDHITLFCLGLGVLGGVLMALGGWTWAVVGILLLDLGSILDGCDGELARLRYQFSLRGEWLDTLSDDVANVALFVGATLNLRAAGVSWAVPVGATALACFVLTQAVLYGRLKRAGRGDLMSLSWGALGGGGQWSLWGKLALLTRRDFFVTAFIPLVAFGRLDVVLLFLAAGAVAVFGTLVVQLVTGSGKG